MAVVEGGASGLLAEVGAANAVPLHVTSKPIPYGALGHYHMSATTGIVAAALAANAQVFTLRWTDATRFFVLLSLRVQFQPVVVFTSALGTDFGVNLNRVTSVSAGGGGVAITVFPKARSSMAASLLGATDVRIATTGALTALTTVELQPIAQSIGRPNIVNAAAGTEELISVLPVLEYAPAVSEGEHPLTLVQNEGIVVANRTVWPAAGTGIFKVEVAWAEVAAY